MKRRNTYQNSSFVKKVEVEHGGDYYSANLTFNVTWENYGEDADGNRGEMRKSIELDKIEDFKKEGKPIDEKDVPKEVIKKFEETEVND